MKMSMRGVELSCAKCHSGVRGNEAADRKAKEILYVGTRTIYQDLATPSRVIIKNTGQKSKGT